MKDFILICRDFFNKTGLFEKAYIRKCCLNFYKDVAFLFDNKWKRKNMSVPRLNNL